MNQIINMVIRQVVRRFVVMGVDMVAKRKSGTQELTPEQRQAAGQNKKRARQAMRVARRIGR